MIILLILLAAWVEFMLVRNRPLRFVLTPAGEKIKKKWGHLTVVASAKYSVPEEVLVGVIGVESFGVANVVNVNANGSIDYGLMQINDHGALTDYRERVGKILNPLDAVENIEVGSWFLREIHQSFLLETWREKIDAYNIGIAGRKKRRNHEYVARFDQFVGL